MAKRTNEATVPSRPSGEIIETPITANLREGLNLMEGVTMQEQVDEISGNTQLVVVDWRGDMVHAGDVLAKIPRAARRGDRQAHSTALAPVQ